MPALVENPSMFNRCPFPHPHLCPLLPAPRPHQLLPGPAATVNLPAGFWGQLWVASAFVGSRWLSPPHNSWRGPGAWGQAGRQVLVNGLAAQPVSLLTLQLPPTLRGSTGHCEHCPAVTGQPLCLQAGCFPFSFVEDSSLKDSDSEAEKGVEGRVGGRGEEGEERGEGNELCG